MFAKLGVVLREHHGSVLLSGVATRNFVSDPLHAEILAIKWGLELAVGHNFNEVLIETDSLLALNEINKGDESLWDKGGLLLNIANLVQIKFPSLFVCCYKRAANSLADN
ncbi:hypothetical protein REPUB_Repub05bG0054000 [Reevesia pubescens]